MLTLTKLIELSEIHPLGFNVILAKDDDEWVSPGGILIPGAHQEYKRRGWIIVVGEGLQCGEEIVKPPYKPGDYVYCDRPFLRPDERESEIGEHRGHPAILVIGREVEAFVSPGVVTKSCAFTVEYKSPPQWARELINHFALTPGGRR